MYTFVHACIEIGGSLFFGTWVGGVMISCVSLVAQDSTKLRHGDELQIVSSFLLSFSWVVKDTSLFAVTI